jgi:hypothetical protein
VGVRGQYNRPSLWRRLADCLAQLQQNDAAIDSYEAGVCPTPPVPLSRTAFVCATNANAHTNSRGHGSRHQYWKPGRRPARTMRHWRGCTAWLATRRVPRPSTSSVRNRGSCRWGHGLSGPLMSGRLCGRTRADAAYREEQLAAVRREVLEGAAGGESATAVASALEAGAAAASSGRGRGGRRGRGGADGVVKRARGAPGSLSPRKRAATGPAGAPRDDDDDDDDDEGESGDDHAEGMRAKAARGAGSAGPASERDGGRGVLSSAVVAQTRAIYDRCRAALDQRATTTVGHTGAGS